VSGAKKLGIQVVDHDTTADAACIWSVLWQGRMRQNKSIYELYKNTGRKVFVIDVGSLSRNMTWKLALNNINNFGDYGFVDRLDNDRPKKLGLHLQDNKKNSGAICVCLQHTESHQLSHLPNYWAWINDTVKHLQKYTERSIVLRPHPRAKFLPAQLQFRYNVSLPRPIVNTYDSFDFDPQQFYAVVNCNSSPGILSAMYGVRPIVDNSSLAQPVSIEPCQIEDNYIQDRSSWLIQLSHTEYTKQELEQALWARRFDHHLIA
jgi:hypothetical protein